MMVVSMWLAAFAGIAAAQYFPPMPEGLRVVNSKHEEGVKISYKEVSFKLFWMLSRISSMLIFISARDL